MVFIKSIALLGSLIASKFAHALDPVNLGTAGDFSILTKTGVTTTGVTKVIGDMGVSPITYAAMTGFALELDSESEFSTSSSGILVGNSRAYAADYGHGTPAKMTQAVYDMEEAYTNAAGRTNDDVVTALADGLLDGEILKPGIYKWTSTVTFTNQVIFDGGPDDVWIMQIAGTFTLNVHSKMELTGGASAENIFWAIADVTAFNDYSHAEGVFLAQTMIAFKDGSSLNGAALAQTAVTMIGATVNKQSNNGDSRLDSCGSINSNTGIERVDLGTAADFAILAETGATTTGKTKVLNGDMGVSPITYASMTGFALVPTVPAASGTAFSTSPMLDDKHRVYAANYVNDGTPAKMTQAVGDMLAAYNKAAGRTNDDVVTALAAGLLDGEILKPGIYKWTSTVTFTNQVIFDGGPDDVWIMQIAGTFVLSTGARMVLTGGARAENIYWAIAGTCTFNADSHAEGIFLAKTLIAFLAGSSLNGAALAQTAVTMDAATINRKSSNGEPEVVSCPPTESPVVAATESPTESPVVPATESPMKSPTKSPTHRPTDRPTEARTECPVDVQLLAVQGATKYGDSPITITERNTSSVTFEVRNSWWPTHSLESLYVQHYSEPGTQCVEYEDVSEDTFTFTASCMHLAPVSIVDVWVVASFDDDEFNDAVVPDCCHPSSEKKAVQYTFRLNCAPCGLVSSRRTEAVEVLFPEQRNLRGDNTLKKEIRRQWLSS